MQEYSADDINRRHFKMQVFLGVLRVKMLITTKADNTDASNNKKENKTKKKKKKKKKTKNKKTHEICP